jgi:hypothetical protein
MATRGGQPGNTNGTKGKLWLEALNRHVTQNPQALRAAASAIFKKAEEGDIAAIKEIGDRLDGKAVQAVEMSGDLNFSFHEVLIKARERAGS